MFNISQVNATGMAIRIGELLRLERGLSRGIKRLFSDMGQINTSQEQDPTSRIHVGFVFDDPKTWSLDFIGQHNHETSAELSARHIGNEPKTFQQRLLAYSVVLDEWWCHPKNCKGERGTLNPKVVLVPEPCGAVPCGYLLVPKIEFFLPSAKKLDAMTHREKYDMLSWFSSVVWLMRSGILKTIPDDDSEQALAVEKLGVFYGHDNRLSFYVSKLETLEFDDPETEYRVINYGSRLLNVMKSHPHLFDKLVHNHDAVSNAIKRLKKVSAVLAESTTTCEET